MLYQINNGTVSLGGKEILSHIDFEIKDREKIAIVGQNGAGKTTLLRLIFGELELDRDDCRMEPGIRTSRKLTIGMMRQNSEVDSEKSVLEALLEKYPHSDSFSRERFQFETEFDRIFMGFGFAQTDKKRKIKSFSGGERTKIELIWMLMEKPDILLLDEPTNHLDIPTVEWLEQYLKRYEKAVIFVSHDRFFLDQVVDIVYEIQNGKTKKYHGNYTEYRKQKVKEIASQKKAYELQEEELKRLNDLIEKFKHKPKKAAFARSRKKIIERMELIEKPQEDDVHIFTGTIDPEILGAKWVVEAEHLKVGYEKVLFEIDLRIRRGQKIAVIGENGVGKTAFIKTISGMLSPLDGKYRLGNHIVMGYFDQLTANIASPKSVVEHFREIFPSMPEKDLRQTLGAYLFSGKKTAVSVNNLSGGEKSRLFLAELLTSHPNFLVLDEPTNHMDIQAKETLESAFQKYAGTMLFVSHDRYFIQQVADAILLIENGQVYYYPFGYEHYIKHCRQKDVEDVSALVRAEDQALVADLKAVPKRERHFGRELSDDEAYLDWKLRLQEEPMRQAKDQVEALYRKRDILLEGMEWTEEIEILEREIQLAEMKWNEECLRWADIYFGIE